MATTNVLSTAISLVRFMHLLQTVPNKDSTTRFEIVGVGDNTTTVFFLDNLGVIEDNFTILSGSTAAAATALTISTDFTLGLDDSRLTLTAAGVTAVGSNTIFAEYSHTNGVLLNTEMIRELNSAENKLLRDTNQVFVDSTVTNPGYRQVSNESIKAFHRDEYLSFDKVFDLFYTSLVKVQTTVNGAYTTGGTTIVLDDASLLPNAATINIGDNKVTYTAKSTNTLTIPSATPSIADAAVVRGEVVELSIAPEGSLPSYRVLTPDTEYETDYDHGRFKPLANAFFGEISADDRRFPSNYLLRVTYMSAWHEFGANPTIPDEIEWVVNAMAARKLMGGVIAKAHTSGLNKFNPTLVNVDMDEINAVIEEYSPLNVGSSQYNKQSLT